MVKKDVYKFNDGRIGTKSYSDKLFKLKEVETGDGNKEMKEVHYFIRKVGSPNEIYEEAIDILPFEYEELSTLEMEEEFKEFFRNKK